jgi:hypothetical protein
MFWKSFAHAHSLLRRLDHRVEPACVGGPSHSRGARPLVLNFYPAAQITQPVFFKDASAQVVLTRTSSNGLASGYVNGAPQFTFSDTIQTVVITNAGQVGGAFYRLRKY